ncbi:tegument protein [pteropodid alphaherpesvirus 2]|uniref:Tegument protein n=1 Tax=pteropodid alphaherpesvirus 2 TaxID=3118716 RepID=A0A510J6W4_9ALPH|nr:tegument protein [pteropodid alphaherpesvirus 2]BBM13186.1 tegument protein [pteropodid alphaherpesvirus 2]
MAAKSAHLELEARLKSRARVEMMRQHATRVKIRVDEQEERREFLAAHRRFLDPALSERLDDVDDQLADREEQLEEAATNISASGDSFLEEGWMSPSDSDLLVMWQLSSAPVVRPGALSAPASPPTCGRSVDDRPGGPGPSLSPLGKTPPANDPSAPASASDSEPDSHDGA